MAPMVWLLPSAEYRAILRGHLDHLSDRGRRLPGHRGCRSFLARAARVARKVLGGHRLPATRTRRPHCRRNRTFCPSGADTGMGLQISGLNGRLYDVVLRCRAHGDLAS